MERPPGWDSQPRGTLTVNKNCPSQDRCRRVMLRTFRLIVKIFSDIHPLR
jgi:hypothetical protein